MRILLMGSDDFAGPLARVGHDVLFCGPGGALPMDDPDPAWLMVKSLLKGRGFSPEVVMVCDHIGGRRLPGGLEQCPAVTVFYGLDSPLNRFWQHPYAQLFDLALLDQPGEVEVLSRLHGNAAWLPVGVDPARYDVARQEAEINKVAFVGVVDDRVRPKRSALLAKVARRAEVEVRGGRKGQWFPTEKAAQLYASHAVTLNENLFPGVTTRPLEGMAAGGCVLTEAAPGAMDRLFADGEHLAYFGPDDLEQKLDLLLGDAALRRRMRQQGRELVRQEHSLEARAGEITRMVKRLTALDPGQRARARGGEALRLEGQALLMAGLRWPRRDGPRRVLRGAARLRAAAADGAQPLPAQQWAGLAMAALGRPEEALPHLARAAEMGGPRQALQWAWAAQHSGNTGQARKATALAGITSQPGEAGFHMQAARVLAENGAGVSVGFNRQGLAVPMWYGLEHLLEYTRVEPLRSNGWLALGELLLDNGAPNQAHQALTRARELGDARAGELIDQAAWQGYLA